MALEFMDSCSHMGSGNIFPPAIPADNKWTSMYPLGCFYETSPVRRTNPAFSATALCLGLNSSNAWKTLTYQSSRYMSAAYYISSAHGGAQRSMFQMLSGGQLLADVSFEIDGTISIYANNTRIWNSATYVWTLDTYHYAEFYVILSGSTNIGITATLKIDGVTLVTAATGNTGINNNNLINAGSTTMNQIGFSGGAGCYIMDVLVMNSSTTDVNGFTTTLNGFQGDVAIMTLIPDADVTTSWSKFPSGAANQYSLVANNPPKDDVDYIYDNTVNDVSAFNMTPITGLTGSLLGAQLCIRVKKDAEGTRAIRAQLNGTDLSNWTGVGLTPIEDQSLYDYYDYFLFPLDSMAGTSWTESNFNSSSFGVKVSV